MGIPQEVLLARGWNWRPFAVSCDEYLRVVWAVSLPFFGSIRWHRATLCGQCVGECFVQTEQPDPATGAPWFYVSSRARARLYRMWFNGLRATTETR